MGRGGRKIRQEMWVARRFTAKIEGAAAWRPSRTEELQLREGTEGRRGRKAKGRQKERRLVVDSGIYLPYSQLHGSGSRGRRSTKHCVALLWGNHLYFETHAPCGFVWLRGHWPYNARTRDSHENALPLGVISGSNDSCVSTMST